MEIKNERNTDDYRELPIEKYIEKHLQVIQMEAQNLWSSRGLTHLHFISVLNNENLVSKNFPPPVETTVEEVKDFIAAISAKGVFPQDISDFIGYLMYMGFFSFYFITFDEWINRKDWRHPSGIRVMKTNKYDDQYTIMEMIVQEHGDDLVRAKLRQLVYWSFPGAW